VASGSWTLCVTARGVISRTHGALEAVCVERMIQARGSDTQVWLTSDGGAYFVWLQERRATDTQVGALCLLCCQRLIREQNTPSVESSSQSDDADIDEEANGTRTHGVALFMPSVGSRAPTPALDDSPFVAVAVVSPQPQPPSRAICAAINTKFSIVAVGLNK